MKNLLAPLAPLALIVSFAFLALLSAPALAQDRPLLRVLNASPNPVEVFWLAPDGRRVSNGGIEPGASRTIATTLGHRFAVVDGEWEAEIESRAPLEAYRYGPEARVGLSSIDGPQAAPPEVRFDPVVREIEGWTVHVDPALLDGPHREEGERALTMVANHLQRIAILVSDGPLAKLREMEIWIERSHPTLKAKQYHPSRQWLIDNGHDPRLERKVHLPQAADLLSREQMLKHPAVVLHELAHAYHHQVLGYDHPEILAAFARAQVAGQYQSVLAHDGRMVRHYALTNEKEYFAEGTEAFLYRNDFYPFVRAELKEHDPVLHDLLERIW